MRSAAIKTANITTDTSADAQAVVVDLAAHKATQASQSIAQQAEEACHLEGNHNDPDFDAFEAKYGLKGFA